MMLCDRDDCLCTYPGILQVHLAVHFYAINNLLQVKEASLLKIKIINIY